MIRSLEVYEATWVAMSVSVSLLIGFVAFVVMMNDKGGNDKQGEERRRGMIEFCCAQKTRVGVFIPFQQIYHDVKEAKKSARRIKRTFRNVEVVVLKRVVLEWQEVRNDPR